MVDHLEEMPVPSPESEPAELADEENDLEAHVEELNGEDQEDSE